MKDRAVRGAIVTSAAQIVKLLVQIASVILLTRLLLPADFGLYAMAAPVIGFAMLFQDFGLTQAIVTARELTQAQAAMMFRINLVLSITVALILAACAPLVSRFYSSPAIAGIILAMSLQIVLSGLAASHKALLSRGMRFRQLAVIDIVSTLCGFAAAVAMALLHPGPWALVIQTLVLAATAAVGCWIAASWAPYGSGRYGEVKPMVHLGFSTTSFNLSNFISRSADNFLIGWARGPGELGVYDRAYKLLLFPLTQVNAPISNVMIPILSRISGEPGRYRAAYLRTVRQMLLFTTPGVTFLIVSAPVLIPTLLGKNWGAAVPIFMWLGLAAAHQTISNTFGWLFISQRRMREYSRYGLFSTASCLAAFWFGLNWGAVGVAAAYAVSGVVLRLPLMVWLVGREGPVTGRDILITFYPYLLACLCAAAAWYFARSLLPQNAILDLICSAAIVYAVAWAAYLLAPAGRATFRESLDLLPRAMLRRLWPSLS
jgi:PST family polysaccharide transporter